MQDSEPNLVERLRDKDKRAFELVFHQYYSLMKAYSMRFLDEQEDAEEVVQDVFVNFWEKCESLTPDSSIRSYLYRAVHNACLNNLKHQRVKDAYKEYVIRFMTETQEFTYSPEEVNLEERIREAINNLPPKCAQIFKLSRFEGLRYQEIADYLEISVKTVEVQMGKALKVLRERLEDLKALG